MMRRICFCLCAAAFVPLAAARADDTKPDAKKTDAATVVVFRLHGTLAEQPGGEDNPFGEAAGPSLKELTGRMAKAAADPAVKAVVIMAEGAAIGTAQK